MIGFRSQLYTSEKDGSIFFSKNDTMNPQSALLEYYLDYSIRVYYHDITGFRNPVKS